MIKFNDKIYFVNDDVGNEIIDNPELYIIYRCMYSYYDFDMSNQDTINFWNNCEIVNLKLAKEKLGAINIERATLAIAKDKENGKSFLSPNTGLEYSAGTAERVFWCHARFP